MTKKPCPRVIFVRHGQTEWSKSGQHTSVTDIDLTPFGIKQMKATGEALFGNQPLNLIDPAHITHIFTSPRLRARHTTELILEAIPAQVRSHIDVEVDDDLAEWYYGKYEGMKPDEIRRYRWDHGVDPPEHKWSIWSDGCEDGENYRDVTTRIDRFIAKLLSIQRKYMEADEASDIIVVAHGHILRCLVARWVHRELSTDPQLMLDAGGVGVLSYQHHNLDEPAIYLAGAFTVPVDEKSDDI
ncbi:uncharacterized protein LODBEIA_P25630 [Lodderomyces beijingensis]|uniref:Phosphoglycerate mutase n=1 Tax=Lodderomyces beijingensis TaxID=1775926 RepID=A0ABP0ZJL2_9ASCO